MSSFILRKIYDRLFQEFGLQKWWPGDTKIEIIVGAILTQNTNWGNVEKALQNLKNADVLNVKSLKEISHSKLATYIRPSGYFNVKSKRLKNFISFLYQEFDGSLRKMNNEDVHSLRIKLLDVKGVGPETADSILLYAFNKKTFVIDAYTKRMLYRHNLAARDVSYADMQKYFTEYFKGSVQENNEYHALIVQLGKEFCKPKPLCEKCPLQRIRYSVQNRCKVCYRALKLKKEVCLSFVCENCLVSD